VKKSVLEVQFGHITARLDHVDGVFQRLHLEVRFHDPVIERAQVDYQSVRALLLGYWEDVGVEPLGPAGNLPYRVFL
jgi:hypothetical protein